MVKRMGEQSKDSKYSYQIFQNIHDGIIVMNDERTIVLMNPAAETLTGWKKNEKVPYCTYCENRNKAEGENKCYLIENDEVPYFLSEMPTYHGKQIKVEMSTALMFNDAQTGKKEYLLVLRDQKIKEKEEEARITKLILRQLIDAQENEHKRLAQELHDGIGQSLYTISLALQSIESRVEDKQLLDYMNDVRTELEHAMNDIKAYSQRLRPQSLDRLGLVASVQSLVSSFNSVHPAIAILLAIEPFGRLPSLVEINVYRVIQEALHNATKYSQASTVEINMKIERGQFLLLIEDNGVGFNVGNLANEGLGLRHMKERIGQLDGEFSLSSQLGEGTKIRVEIPLKDGEQR